MQERAPSAETKLLGVGLYTVPEASRLLKLPSRNINRWLGGYSYRRLDGLRSAPPLWQPQLPAHNGRIELGFRDLMELRLIHAFTGAGLSLKTIRNCLERARQHVNDERPFSTRRFRTDGKTIFFDSLRASGESELVDLKQNQYAMKDVIEASFRDLDIDHETVVRWRPFKGKIEIVVDPQRSFGQPILTASGVPTAALAVAVRAEGSIQRAARLFELPAAQVKAAVDFEQSLLAA